MWLQVGVLPCRTESCFQLGKVSCISFLPQIAPNLLHLFIFVSLHEWGKIVFGNSKMAEWNNRFLFPKGTFEGDWIALSLQAIFYTIFYLTNWLWQMSPKLCCSSWFDAKAEAEQATSVDEIEKLCVGIFLIDFSSIWYQLITDFLSVNYWEPFTA